MKPCDPLQSENTEPLVLSRNKIATKLAAVGIEGLVNEVKKCQAFPPLFCNI